MTYVRRYARTYARGDGSSMHGRAVGSDTDTAIVLFRRLTGRPAVVVLFDPSSWVSIVNVPLGSGWVCHVPAVVFSGLHFVTWPPALFAAILLVVDWQRS